MSEYGNNCIDTHLRIRRWQVVAVVIAFVSSGIVLVGQVKAGEATSALVASAGNAQVTLTFTEPDTAPGLTSGSTTGYTLENFQVKVYDSNTTTVLGRTTCVNGGGQNESCVVTSFTPEGGGANANVTNGVQYSFGLLAQWERNSDLILVSGPESARSEVVTPFTVPSAPGQPTAEVNSLIPTSVDVSWADAISNGNAIDLYTVQIWNKAGSSPVLVNSSNIGCTTATLTCTVSGLSNGVAYTFKVKANNDAGDSSYSVVSNSIMIAPGVPTNVTATVLLNESDTEVKVTWDEPAGNVETITEYTVTATPQSGSAVIKTWSSGTREAVYTAGESSESLDLVLGTAYAVTVKAKNATYGNESATISVTPTEIPGAPDAAPNATPASTSVDLSWNPPNVTGGSPVSAYTAGIWAGTASTTLSTPLFTCTTNGATSCTVQGLFSETAYKAAVKATNDVGDGNWSPLSTDAFQTTATPSPTTTATPSPTTTATPSPTTTATPSPTTTATPSPTTTATPSPTTTATPSPTTVPTTATTTALSPPPVISVAGLAGTPVRISRKPSASLARNLEIAVSKSKVLFIFTVPKSRSSKTQITKYTITLKPTRGATITRTINVKPGVTIKPVINGKKSTTYSMTITAQTKSGKKVSWKAPKVKTGK